MFGLFERIAILAEKPSSGDFLVLLICILGGDFFTF